MGALYWRLFITFTHMPRKVNYRIYGPNYFMVKTYKIYATGLSELEVKLNQFFERYPQMDILSINSSRSITGMEFALGLSRKQIVFSIMFD